MLCDNKVVTLIPLILIQLTMGEISLYDDCVMLGYNKEVRGGRSYPAVLIGRLGVNCEFQNTPIHIGRQLMSFIKDWFRHEDNKTGCRFIVVDAYNEKMCFDTTRKMALFPTRRKR